MERCRYCHKPYHRNGIKQHERRCPRRPRPDTTDVIHPFVGRAKEMVKKREAK